MYALVDTAARAAKTPQSFVVPDDVAIAALEIGHYVQLGFPFEPEEPEGQSERMWVEITTIGGDGFAGELSADPVFATYVADRDPVQFERKHIMKIYGGW